jgi:GNAT superfamily N-acetyltransferase
VRVFPLIRAVIDGAQPGHVFAGGAVGSDDTFVVTRFGFAQWIGDEDDSLVQTVATLIRDGDGRLPRYWLWYSPPARWQGRLDGAAQGRVRRRERWRFAWRAARPRLSSPVDIDVRLVDAGLANEASSLGVDLGSRFWPSLDAFLEGGFGVCARADGQVVSLCYAACVAGGEAEVDIVTRPEYRGHGFAGAVARRFVHECLERGLQPTWDCFRENAASMRLAQGLGFTFEEAYWMYSFGVPLDYPDPAEAPPG